MFGIGIPEILIIALVAIVFLNPKDLPGLFRNVGKGYHQIRRMREDFLKEVNDIKQGFDITGTAGGSNSPTGSTETKGNETDKVASSSTDEKKQDRQGEVT